MYVLRVVQTQIEASCAILENILRDTNVKEEFKAAGLGEEDVKFIKALIKGEVLSFAICC